MKKIGIIGSGDVGRSLGKGFIKYGYQVMLGTGNPQKEKVQEWLKTQGSNASVGSFTDTAAFGDILVLAVTGRIAGEVVKQLNPIHTAGKTFIDATNPIAEKPPVNGVIPFFTDLNESLMEQLQKLAPNANFVKAFNSVGNAFMVDPAFPGGKPSMFICGNNEGAKQDVTAILTQFGWETEDMGMMESARAIEPLCILWCIPGMNKGQWTHAFKLLKM